MYILVAAFQISRYKSPGCEGLDCAYYGGVGKLGGIHTSKYRVSKLFKRSFVFYKFKQ